MEENSNLYELCDFIDSYIKSDRELLSEHIKMVKDRIHKSLLKNGSPNIDVLLKRL